MRRHPSSADPADPPSWFQAAVSVRADPFEVMAGETRIHYRRWPSDPKLPALLLIHGNGAHSHWWDFIAPALTDRFQVIAMDLSGAGDSAHRDLYSMDRFAEEVIAVARHSGCIDNMWLVAHSFGGSVARITTSLHPGVFRGLVLIDSALMRRTHPTAGQRVRSSGSGQDRQAPARTPKTRYYQSHGEASRRFKLRPPQPCENRYILDYIGAHSVRETPLGWCWKLDQALFSRMEHRVAPASDAWLTGVDHAGLIYGEHSRFFDTDGIEYARQLLGRDNVICIESAHHHVFLDQPGPFIRELSNLLSRWNGQPNDAGEVGVTADGAD